MAADIRSVRPPEPYKGKGIRYVDERVRAQGREGRCQSDERFTHRRTAPPPLPGAQAPARVPATRPRLAVFRSNRYIYAQVIDDDAGRTLAAASSQRRRPAEKTLTVETAPRSAS